VRGGGGEGERRDQIYSGLLRKQRATAADASAPLSALIAD